MLQSDGRPKKPVEKAKKELDEHRGSPARQAPVHRRRPFARRPEFVFSRLKPRRAAQALSLGSPGRPKRRSNALRTVCARCERNMAGQAAVCHARQRPAIGKAVKDFNASAKKQFGLGPSEFFRNEDKTLAEVEKIVAETRSRVSFRTQGDLKYVSVLLNGRKTLDMVFDTAPWSSCSPEDGHRGRNQSRWGQAGNRGGHG